jgi:UDP-N-acetylglucosamine 2-epimerase
VGARPQFIKAAAVSPMLRREHHEILLHTGQHYDDGMSDRFFRELPIPAPDIELGVGSASHAEQTARMLTGIERAIVEVKPALVLVYGDTNSTLAGALAAAKLHVKVAHVEAGLRSFNRRMPEEINRVITDQLSALLFCPSESAAQTLRREGITAGVHVVGDVMADALALASDPAGDATIMESQQVRPRGYVLATVHRAENTDDPARLAAIAAGLSGAGERVIFPVHPRTRAALARLGVRMSPQVTLIDPVGYRAMVALERHARVIVTDSGGVQKEAYWLGVPCVTVRDETEWIETVANGWNVLTGANAEKIVSAVRGVAAPPARPPLYGEGQAVANIMKVLQCCA